MGRFRPGQNRDRNSGGRFGRDRNFREDSFERRSSERKPLELHEVTCDKCGKQTEVPFKPKGDKPVYCRECFGGKPSERREGGQGNSDVSTQLAEINRKLDKIMKNLDI